MTIAGLLPEPRFADQIDAGDRALTDLGGQLGDIVEVLLRSAAHDAVGVEGRHPFGIVLRDRDIHGKRFPAF